MNPLPESVPAVMLVSAPVELLLVKFTAPTETKYGPPAGALTPVLPLHSLLPESPLDAENVMPLAAACCAFELVAFANEVSADSQPPNEELTTVAIPSLTA